MRKVVLKASVGALALLMGGCTYFSFLPWVNDPNGTEVVEVDPVIPPEATPDPSETAQATLPVPTAPGLIQPTNPDERVQQLEIGREDPFAPLPVQPTVTVVPNGNGNGNGNDTAAGTDEGTATTPQLNGGVAQGTLPQTFVPVAPAPTGGFQGSTPTATAAQPQAPTQTAARPPAQPAQTAARPPAQAPAQAARPQAQPAQTAARPQTQAPAQAARPQAQPAQTAARPQAPAQAARPQAQPAQTAARPQAPAQAARPPAQPAQTTARPPAQQGQQAPQSIPRPPAIGDLPGDNGAIPSFPPIPQPDLANSIAVTGVVQVGNVAQVILRAPNEPHSRYVRAGQYVSNGQVLVKRIDMNSGPVPIVVFEEYGIEVAREVGTGVPTGGVAATSTPVASNVRRQS